METVHAADLPPSPSQAPDQPVFQDIVVVERTAGHGMPYPGLRPFGRDEMEIFFGREAALDTMLDRLAETKFLAVLGPSGCGKSSLVRTGLYSALTLGLLPHAGGRWRIAEFTPGRQPIRNLALALTNIRNAGDGTQPDQADTVELVAAHLQRGPRSIVELVDGGLLGKKEEEWNLLIVVDQFEELFRFRDYAGREKAEALSELLLESARSALPIHAVITMRSEYLGACSLIPGLAEQISSGMYLTPRMTREECRQAIEGPADARGFEVEPGLVTHLLNDLHNFAAFDQPEGVDQGEQLSLQADQLPLMQHLLNRMWRRATVKHSRASSGAGNSASVGRVRITDNDYEAVGGLTGALDEHGQEIIDGLRDEFGDGVVETIARLFRALVDGPSLPLAVRRPRSLCELIRAAGGEEKRLEVERIIEAFRGPSCNFLRTSDDDLADDVLIDLGHESLIRRWSKFSAWFAAEVEAREMWTRLSRDAELWKQGQMNSPRDLGLRRFTDWWNREQPMPYVSQRYGGDFDDVRNFLRAGKAGEKRQKFFRVFALTLVIGAIIVGIKLFYWENQRRIENEYKQQQLYALRTSISEKSISLLAIRKWFSLRYCPRAVEGSASYEECLDSLITFMQRNYVLHRQRQAQGQLPSVSSGPAGGVVGASQPAPSMGGTME
jgi:hypothetical protein